MKGTSSVAEELECLVKRHDIDIIALIDTQEGNGKSKYSPYIQRKYSIYGTKNKLNHGGVAILVKKTMLQLYPNHKHIQHHDNFVELVIGPPGNEIHIHAIYHRPWNNEELPTLHNRGQRIIAMGDWNCRYYITDTTEAKLTATDENYKTWMTRQDMTPLTQKV